MEIKMDRPSDNGLSPETASLLKEAFKSRRDMFAETPSILPAFHRRLRASALERTSLRDTLLSRLGEWMEPLSGFADLIALRPAAGLGYAAAVLLVAGVVVTGLNESWKGSDRPLLTLEQQAPSPASFPGAEVNYAVNDVTVTPVSFDQKIDQAITGASIQSGHDAAGAHYVLTSSPATYDSVVSF